LTDAGNAGAMFAAAPTRRAAASYFRSLHTSPGISMRRLLLSLSLSMVLAPIPAALAQVSIGIGAPGVSIGINLNAYPSLVRVPGYPVYYDPRGDSNYFFYDGQYWVYREDNWYASSWYNGPWVSVQPAYVPLYVLRVPVRYYRQPPTYFRGWRADAPPRWGDHWGRDWERSRAGWNQWNRNNTPRPAPLPVYQRQYSGDRYPGSYDRQREIRTRNYSYQPRESITQQHFQPRVSPGGPDNGPRGRDSRNDSQGNDRGNRPDPRGNDRGNRPDSQGNDRGNRPDTPRNERGNRLESQGNDRGNPAESQGKGRDKKD